MFIDKETFEEARGIFWEEFQSTGVSREVFNILFNAAVNKLFNKLMRSIEAYNRST